ncbi:gliding motility-associated C-terminal domain-containing protein [Hymenobacter jejuensis]|uniref:Gliding motility-associated C-terminal domain-containing protein n=1 Tax=Hymenobacter jejuensis TaxID=2502781 RepID=A0A5B8A4D7_9BACT|nr:gliding motility-associated C-terminal domain-containing protein [Hymenobacter jejuensis]QDA62117.1 gliding motility-associated C-terminal domain-containing protein [Hymenobacter jejuensis]
MNAFLQRFSFRKYAGLLLLLLISQVAHATHIVGGELDLQYKSGGSYQLTLTLYFDAINGSPGALDNDLTATIFEKGTNRRMQDIVLPLTNNTFVAYTNPACTSPSLSTRQLIYSRAIDLPAASYSNGTGYYVAVERCCRNNGISNIVAPGDAGQTFYLEFPAVSRRGQPFIDSTPRIFPPLSDYACRGELFYYNFGGQDIDGDSLVYELVTPLNGHSTAAPTNSKPLALPAPYGNITWNAGLSATNQIPGTPTLSIGRQTGRLEVRPSQLGLFVFGIRCSEYRKGEKIGEVRRDFQLKVLNCPQNQAPSLTVRTTGRTRAYREGVDTLRLTTSNRCATLRFTDLDPASRLSLSLHPVNFTGALPELSLAQGTVRTQGAPDTLVSQLCFPACLDTKGKVYLLDVIVADDGCSLPKRDTVQVAFTSQPDPNAAPSLVSTAGPTFPLHVRPGATITFDLTATDPENDPLTLEMTGRGFAPTSLGAQLVQGISNNQLRGRFTWRAPCPTASKSLYEFEFTAAASPCNTKQTASVVVPIQIDYQNVGPTLTSSQPLALTGEAPVVVRRPLGGTYEVTLEGLDADADQLTLTAAGKDFDLAAAGMSFEPHNGAGRATGVFRWQASCDAVTALGALEVTFQLQEATCLPKPQIRTVRFEVTNTDTASFLPPNVFTPNNDGKNDFFTMPALPPDFCDSRFAVIRIFTRWGNEVYRTTDRTFSWDGGQLPSGAYLYLIEYTNKKRFKGLVTIAR